MRQTHCRRSAAIVLMGSASWWCKVRVENFFHQRGHRLCAPRPWFIAALPRLCVLPIYQLNRAKVIDKRDISGLGTGSNNKISDDPQFQRDGRFCRLEDWTHFKSERPNQHILISLWQISQHKGSAHVAFTNWACGARVHIMRHIPQRSFSIKFNGSEKIQAQYKK